MKKVIAALIIAVIVVIGTASALLYNNNISNSDDGQLANTEKAINTTGRHFTVELQESVDITGNP